MFIEVTTDKGKELVNTDYISKIYREIKKLGITTIVVGEPVIIPTAKGLINGENTIEAKESYDEIKKLINDSYYSHINPPLIDCTE